MDYLKDGFKTSSKMSSTKHEGSKISLKMDCTKREGSKTLPRTDCTKLEGSKTSPKLDLTKYKGSNIPPENPFLNQGMDIHDWSEQESQSYDIEMDLLANFLNILEAKFPCNQNQKAERKIGFSQTVDRNDASEGAGNSTANREPLGAQPAVEDDNDDETPADF